MRRTLKPPRNPPPPEQPTSEPNKPPPKGDSWDINNIRDSLGAGGPRRPMFGIAAAGASNAGAATSLSEAARNRTSTLAAVSDNVGNNDDDNNDAEDNEDDNNAKKDNNDDDDDDDSDSLLVPLPQPPAPPSSSRPRANARQPATGGAGGAVPKRSTTLAKQLLTMRTAIDRKYRSENATVKSAKTAAALAARQPVPSTSKQWQTEQSAGRPAGRDRSSSGNRRKAQHQPMVDLGCIEFQDSTTAVAERPMPVGSRDSRVDDGDDPMIGMQVVEPSQQRPLCSDDEDDDDDDDVRAFDFRLAGNVHEMPVPTDRPIQLYSLNNRCDTLRTLPISRRWDGLDYEQLHAERLERLDERIAEQRPELAAILRQLRSSGGFGGVGGVGGSNAKLVRKCAFLRAAINYTLRVLRRPLMQFEIGQTLHELQVQYK